MPTFSWEMRANACARKKRNSTPELWRPCRLRSGYGDEWITRVKKPQASKRHRKHEKTHFLEWLLGRFRAKNGGSQEPAKRRTFPIFAGTHRFSWSKIGDFALGHETIWSSILFAHNLCHWQLSLGKAKSSEHVQMFGVRVNAREHVSIHLLKSLLIYAMLWPVPSLSSLSGFPFTVSPWQKTQRLRMKNTERSWRTWFKDLIGLIPVSRLFCFTSVFLFSRFCGKCCK